MVRFLSAALLAAAASATPAAAFAHCYSVYDKKDVLIFQSTQSPVDLRQPISEAIKQRFSTDARMVFTPNSDDCPAVDKTVTPTGVPDFSQTPRR
ncbi:hypothetical protein [Diaphorobacter aerolatus]|uniref:Uncharacterized protein n=1 Tax=Diaphorobacter aerolatus TaxID=1288495 RepID=A0A7H0GLU1_9BURK|nr:hypothetical protein [Diaphorobacter aerolatus]QNP49257.1 hypothetical protein H9K75_03960 [Diaphorobacter aerolatus]